MVDWFQKVLSKEWNIKTAGGLTGNAYIAEKNGRRLFLKRNSSPFLAVLSAEGIVPKLIWTKRMDNGDVITAQEWLEGRILTPKEMKHQHVADLLYKIHHSSELLYMLMRLGKTPKTSDERLLQVNKRLQSADLVTKHEEVEYSLEILQTLIPVTRNRKMVVCHGDMNHHNLLLTKNKELYLIDWENAMIADPVVDYGQILKWYVPEQEWKHWLKNYGVTMDQQLIKRMFWYLILDCLYYLSWHTDRKNGHEVPKHLRNLRELNHHVNKLI